MVERAKFESRCTQVQSASLSLRIHSLCSRDERADGLPVVFVPGLGASCRTMLPTARLMPSERDVFIVDLPSHGESEKPSRPLSLAEYAAVTAAWLDALQLERAVLVGHSFGSQVLVELAVDRPAVIDGLVLISPTVDSHARTMASQLARLLLDAIREPPGLLRLLLRDYLTTGFRRMRYLGRAAIRDRVEDKLPSIEAPTLLVRGARDPLVPERWAKQMASLLPHPKLVVIPKGTHAVQYQSADAVARALQEFLRELIRFRSRAT
jgi:2-hydroxy-6-oxonona-2,4-dienedioate hydrolase